MRYKIRDKEARIKNLQKSIDKKYPNNKTTVVDLVHREGSGNTFILRCKDHGEYEAGVEVAVILKSNKLKCKNCRKWDNPNNWRPRRKRANDRYLTDNWVMEMNERFDNKYEYLIDSERVKALDKVRIICPIHGEFQQQVAEHQKAQYGCMKCANSHNGGWGRAKWKDLAENSENFDGYKVYVIECWSEEGEHFIKVGRTFSTVGYRFKVGMPYHFEVLRTYKGKLKEVYNLELNLKKELKEFKYLPSEKFSGYEECFTVDAFQYIIHNYG